MNLHKFIPALMLTAASTVAMVSCSEDPELPPMIVPTATTVDSVNTTIKAVKEKYWNSDKNYIDTIGLTESGQHVYVKGRITGNDVSGNVYKYLYIQDETAALAFSIDNSSLSDSYKVGQEVIVDLTNMYIGKYSSELLVGNPEWYSSGNTWEAGRMTLDAFASHAQTNGLANTDKLTVTTTDIATIQAATDQDGLIAWGHMLVRFDDVTISGAGKTFNDNSNTSTSTTFYHTITDAAGNSMPMPISSYADFANEIVPSGSGSVTGIICYKYNSSNRSTEWQLYVVDYDAFSNFDGNDASGDNSETPGTDNEGQGAGTQASPYTVAQAISLNNPGTTAWVSGYIVGNVLDKSYETASFTATDAVATNVLIADSADETDATKCIPVQLPSGSVRSAINLKDNPGNLHKKVSLYGSLESYFGTAGLKSVTEFELEGYVAPATKGFVPVTSITSGESYAIWASNKVGVAFDATRTYGYLYVTDSTPAADGTISTEEANTFVLTNQGDGWSICGANGVYLYMTSGTYTSFQLTTTPTLTDPYYLWTITPQADGTFEIKNNGNGYVVQYSESYTSFGVYPDSRGVLPKLYQLKK
jgi:uncharacterized protein YdeI (BOF family)